MEKVKGFGGVFFKANDPDALAKWYREHLGLKVEDFGGVVFKWRDQEDPTQEGYSLWSMFKASSEYFGPGPHAYMFNFRVDDLDAMLAQLRALGAQVEDKIEESEFGRFGWVTDPEGRRIELWQPPR